MGYSFTDPGAEGCCRSLNALFGSVRATKGHILLPGRLKSRAKIDLIQMYFHLASLDMILT